MKKIMIMVVVLIGSSNISWSAELEMLRNNSELNPVSAETMRQSEINVQLVTEEVPIIKTGIVAQASCGGRVLVEHGGGVQQIMIKRPLDMGVLQCFRDYSQIPGLSTDMPTRLLLDNPGGVILTALSLGFRIADMAEEVQKKSGYPLQVVVDKECASMCIAVFANVANKARGPWHDVMKVSVSKTAKFGFHSASSGGEIDWRWTDMYIKNLMNDGVSKDWIENNQGIFQSRKVTWVDAQTLVNTGSGLVISNELR